MLLIFETDLKISLRLIKVSLSVGGCVEVVVVGCFCFFLLLLVFFWGGAGVPLDWHISLCQ